MKNFPVQGQSKDFNYQLNSASFNGGLAPKVLLLTLIHFSIGPLHPFVKSRV